MVLMVAVGPGVVDHNVGGVVRSGAKSITGILVVGGVGGGGMEVAVEVVVEAEARWEVISCIRRTLAA
jgi:hypothetical protein